MRGLFVTGTDTGAGKTVLTAAITACLRACGLDAQGLKPVVTGLAEPADAPWPRDHELLAQVSQCVPEKVCFATYGPAVSPHLAAELEHRPLEPQALLDSIGAAAGEHEIVVVEGVGGLLVPLSESYDVRALARALELPVVIAARPGLGTITPTLLTLEAARHAGLEVLAVVLTPWPEPAGELERSNRQTIELLGGTEVAVLPFVEHPDRGALAAAAAGLPIADWI